ncbi:exocyst complex component Sec10-domain-containing protein, partial [Naematelia encephala]
MSSWAPMAPSKPNSGSKTGAGSSKFPAARFTSVLKPSKPIAPGVAVVGPRVGRWPESIVLQIVSYLPVHDLPQVARANRALSRIVRDDKGWQIRCSVLGLQADDTPRPEVVNAPKPPPPPRKSMADDDFGDFASNGNDLFEDVDFGDFETPKPAAKKEANLLDFDELPLPSKPKGGGANARATGFFALPTAVPPAGSLGTYYLTYKRHHLSLVPLCRHLRTSPSPSSTLALLFPPSTPLIHQADLLLALVLFLSPRIQPLHDWGFLRQALLAAADRFDSTCLVAFETADSRHDEDGMRQAAESSWKVWDAGGGGRDQWECGRVWVEKREVFYETGKWDPLENIVKIQGPTGTVRQLDFTPMDAFIAHVLEAFRLDAQVATRVFPATARVVLSFCERVATDVIGEYIQPLLAQARIVSLDIFLQSTAATFVQAWKLVDVAMDVLGEQSITPRTKIEDVVFRMFEVNMDEYLDEETEWVKQVLEGICKTWEQQLGSTGGVAAPASAPTFLTASNPDQVKRNVLAGFRDALLLPVTIVPRTVTFGVNALVTGSTQAVSGLAMLNPQKWAGSNGRARVEKEVVEEALSEKVETLQIEPQVHDEEKSRPSTPTPDKSFDRLQMLVSLETSLELIQADRDSLKRTETFSRYPGKYGHKVREAIEEIFILLLKAAGDRHIAPGFRIATNQMSTWKPADHEETMSVAPLLQFFELVHVGDTIQSMIQVYFDKELAQYVDKTDFLNAVMREKKRFESVLDDAVAAGLNAGIEVLMNQVEHIIMVKTGPREYYPVDGVPLELGPTEGCREAIACLEMHCNLLRGSTSKEVLEVFYQEVGIRLQAILQRHLKRQIISLEGGFQIIADLNAYHSFVASLKQQRITDDFSNLKMLGHVYIVSDAKDLAQIVRDVTRYGGTFRPEDIYEFIQRRSDWKKIEKTVDKVSESVRNASLTWLMISGNVRAVC